jgi:hypothetical protein
LTIGSNRGALSSQIDHGARRRPAAGGRRPAQGRHAAKQVFTRVRWRSWWRQGRWLGWTEAGGAVWSRWWPLEPKIK